MKNLIITSLLVVQVLFLKAQVAPHHIFDNNMILQRDKPVKIWGKASPGERVEVEFAGKSKITHTNNEGEWFVFLDPMAANNQPREMKISGDGNEVRFSGVLVGDLWVLGGQSNMEFDLNRIYYGDMEVASANYPQLRLMTIPKAAGPEPMDNFERINEYDGWYNRYDKKGYWFSCSPETVETFSAMGYIFGRRIHMTTGIPIGLIDVSVGGTTIEAWISPEMLSKMPENNDLLEDWERNIEAYDPEESLRQRIENWEKRSEARIKQGLEPGPKPTEPGQDPATDRNRPGSSWNGMVAPIEGLTVKGIIFHHGYNNALTGTARPDLYAANFNALIKDWRNTFNDDDLAFGIVEFSAGGQPQTYDNFELQMVDAAPYIREGQLKAYHNLNNVGYVAINDQQENWYHPRKKTEAGERIARWALNTQYDYDFGWEPAVVKDIDVNNESIIITFSKEIKTSDDRPFEGFAIAGKNGHFYPAKADYLMIRDDEQNRMVPDKTRLILRNDLVKNPLEVRYAWARNPLGNAVNNNGNERMIHVPLFRTDSWDFPEAGYGEEGYKKHREQVLLLQNQAKEWNGIRRKEEREQNIKMSNK